VLGQLGAGPYIFLKVRGLFTMDNPLQKELLGAMFPVHGASTILCVLLGVRVMLGGYPACHNSDPEEVDEVVIDSVITNDK
jgi:hypothetical protein